MSVVPAEMLEEAARRFALLSDPTRLRIVSTLHALGPTTVGALAEAAGTTMTNVSQHLARLAAGGIVARRREGRSVVYWVSDPAIEDLCRIVCASLGHRTRLSSRAPS
jgi:DNA-binding transcriptional ArsR family regulator